MLWVLGFEVTPNLHVGFHELLAHHHHGDEHADHHDHDDDSPEHGEGSIEHRGVAIFDAPPPPVVPKAILVECRAACEAVHVAPADRRPLTIRGRGPPVVAFS